MMKKGLFILLLLIITALPALAAPTNTSGPWGVSASAFKNLSSALASPATASKTVVVDKPMAINTKTTNRVIKVMPGGSINVASGQTLTMPVPEAGRYQIFYGTGYIVFSGGSTAYPEWDGSFPGLLTDTSAAFNRAINRGVKVDLQIGTYVVNAVHTTGYLVLTGAGNTATYLKSYTAAGYAFSEQVLSSNWKNTLVMNDLHITGDPAGGTLGGRGGFVFGNPGAYAANIELAGRCEFNNVAFWNCDKAFYKPYGNIGNTFNKCSWAGNQFGYYAADDSVHTMHPGNDTFNDGEFSANVLAAVYINGAGFTSGQTTFNQTVIEGNAGFGIFVYGYKESYVPLKMSGVHFEANHSSGSVTINGTAYTPVDVYLRNTPYAVMDSCGIASVTLVNSSLRESNCTINTAAPFTSHDSVDINSTLFSDNANLIYQTGATKRIITSIGNVLGPSGGSANILLTSYRDNIVHTGSRIAGNDYSNRDTYPFAGSVSINATTVADGVLFDSCAEITVADGQTVMDNTGHAGISYTAGKWYTWSADVKLITAIVPVVSASGAATFFGNIGPILIQNKWVSLAGVTQATATSSATFPYIINSTGAAATLRFSAVQVVEFNTKFEAMQYFNDRKFQPTPQYRREVYSNVAPTTGTWNTGDRVMQTIPTVGQPKSWACTVGGTPGTWVSEGNL